MRQFLLPGRYGGESRVNLRGADFHYLIRVLRKREGDGLAAVSVAGARYAMRVETVGRASCTVTLTPVAPEESRAEQKGFEIRLLQCLPKGRKMDLIVRQAVEAGVGCIVPVASDHAVPVTEDSALRLARWRRIAREALQQSGNSRLAIIGNPLTLAEAAVLDRDHETGLFFHQERIGEESLHGALSGALDGGAGRVGLGMGLRVNLLIGPEGGLSERETLLLKESGFRPVFLGEAVLRTETAAIYAIAAVNTVLRERSSWRLSE